MADANWLRKTRSAPEFDEDPFAELTRIMGFDPRIPFNGAGQSEAPRQVTAPQVDAGDADLDLTFDLEQELMGALEREAPIATAMQRAPRTGAAFHVVQPTAHQAFAAAAPQAGLPDQPAHDEQAFDAVATGETVGQPAGARSDADPAWSDEEAADLVRYAAHEPDAAASVEATRFADRHFDDDAEPMGWSAHEGGATGLQYEAADRDVESDVADEARFDQAEDAGEQALIGANDAEAGSGMAEGDGGDQTALAAELDEALSASLDGDPLYDDGWLHEPEAEFVAPAFDTSPHDVQPDQFAGDFDAAMADVDMDFTLAEPALPQATWDGAQTAHGSPDDPSNMTSGDFDTADPAAFDAADPVAFDGGAYAESETDAFSGYALDEQDFEASAPAVFEPPADEASSYDAGPPAIGQSEIDDAIAELAAMVRGYERPADVVETIDDAVDYPMDMADSSDFPEIETIDVPENAVALADDLDIPDVAYADDAAPSFDDLDAELAAAFGEPAIETIQVVQVDDQAQPEFDLNAGYAADVAGFTSYGGMAASAFGDYRSASVHGRPDDAQAVGEEPDADGFGQGDFEVDADPEDDLAATNVAHGLARPSPRRGFVVASIVGGIAVVGAIGAFAFTGGDAIGSGEPAVVRADTDPVKVRPENPGGAVVANRDSGVFDRAAGETPGQPQQAELISTQEEPVDVAARFPEAAAEPIDESVDIDALAGESVKSEDRIEPAGQPIAAAEAETLAVPPRKVRTMIVKPDGTLVPREEVTTEQPATVGSTTATSSLTDPAISAPQPSEDLAAADAAPAATPAETPAADQPATAAADQTANEAAADQTNAPAAVDDAQSSGAAVAGMPDSVPVAPSRPADQPLDIVGEVKPDQVASLDPQAAAPAGGWSVQIASQPSEAAAQATYKDLSSRYASVLGNRSANIVKAEIAGKGTFWRVRVPAGSRNEAIDLCESYKGAGGNCFVSK